MAVSPEHAYEPYVRRLVREIELSQFAGPPETIFFGGGTPSAIDAGLIEFIVQALPAGAAELSLEANPGTLGAGKIERLRRIGINRISLGAQSFHDEDLENAGRLHKARDVLADFESLRHAGFRNINIDLIAGLPGQKLSIWRENLSCIGRLLPEHVSIYMLDMEERSVWGGNVRNVPAGVPNEDEYAEFYLEAAGRLGQMGYVHYEISNWALPGFECRHNLKYWIGTDYRGFGVSAHSFEQGTRFWNSSSLVEYARMLDAGNLPVAGQELLTPEMRLEEAFLLGLRRIAGFDICHVAEHLGFSYPPEWFRRVDDLQRNGLVHLDGTVLKLAPDGWLLANSITEELLWPTLLSTFEATP